MPSENIQLYKKLMNNLAVNIEKRIENDGISKSSGFIIGTAAWTSGIEIIQQAVESFHVDIILVIGTDMLYSLLLKEYDNTPVTVVKLPKSGGVVPRSTPDRRRTRRRAVHEYFYGNVASPLSPARIELKYSSYRLLKARGPTLPGHLMPVRFTAAEDPLQLDPVQLSADLKTCLVAVYHDSSDDAANQRNVENLIESNVAGFLYVVDVDLDNGLLIVLAPCPGNLPSKNVVVGTIRESIE